MIRQRLRGLAAVLGIIVLLAGMPTVLLQVGFGALPRIEGWADLVGLLLSRDDGSLALIVLKAIGWITWALLAGLILWETLSRARGRHARDLPGLRLPQTVARQLVTTAAALFVSLPAPTTVAYAAPEPGPAITSTETPPAATTAVVDDDPATAAEAPTRQHTVKRGESLWSIAATELGNGRRYTEIAALNTTLLNGRGDDFLRTGWVLTLPADPTDDTASDASEPAYTVRKGDTLSAIARDHLGDAQAYPQIFEASRHITQPNGHQLTDPDVIDIGWTLTIPHTTPAADPGPTVTAAPAGPVAPTPAAEPAEAMPTPAAADVRHPNADPDDAGTGESAEVADATTPAWLLPGLVGAGSLAAGSLWLALRRRRAAQTRVRRPGRMLASLPAELLPVDKTLRTEGAHAALDVAFIDEALRRLATTRGRASRPMPQVAAVEHTPDHVRLHLTEPLDLPEPWQQAPDQLRWEIPTTLDLTRIGPLDSGLPAPYPQLVTLGIDGRGHQWLYNLEEAGVVRVTGDPEHVGNYARHVAAELAVSPWTPDVKVDCVGIASEAVELNPYRVRHHSHPDVTAAVIADAVAMIDRTREAGLDITTGRATLLDDPIWDSRHLLLNTDRTQHTDQLAALLRDHPHATGTALLLLDPAGTHADMDAGTLNLTADGRLQFPAVGLELNAAGLTQREAAGCAAIFAQADQPDVDIPPHPEPATGWRAHTNQAGQLLPELTQPRDQAPADDTASVLPEPDDTYLDVAATTSEDLATLAPQVAVEVRERVEHDDPSLDEDVRTWLDPQCDLPKLKVLGPLTVRVAPTGAPIASAGRKPYFTELLAYLATRPHGATTDEVADAMRIPIDRVRKDILTLRTWLGTNPRTGRPHIPDSRQTAAATVRGKPTYQIEDILIDADLFRRLRARGEARGPAGLNDLRQALSLATGTPFSQLRRDGGAWLSDGEPLDQILQCAIVDVAHLVATASLAEDDPAAAQTAAELAIRVAPAEETPQLDLAAALEAQGHDQAAARLLVDRVLDRSDGEDEAPEELPTRTDSIIANQQWKPRRRIRASA